jgi:hypothetical protein
LIQATFGVAQSRLGIWCSRRTGFSALQHPSSKRQKFVVEGASCQEIYMRAKIGTVENVVGVVVVIGKIVGAIVNIVSGPS